MVLYVVTLAAVLLGVAVFCAVQKCKYILYLAFTDMVLQRYKCSHNNFCSKNGLTST